MRELLLGLDLGIASCGWSLIEVEDNAARILALGTRMWDAPEDPKEGTPNNAKRRLHRGQRRVIDRRRKRMNLARELLHEAGLLPSPGKHILQMRGLDPWDLRVAGLDRLLKPDEFAVALGHIARHRGFRSNSKSDQGANAPAEGKKMLGALAKSREHLAKWRTVGEMIACDQNFLARKRNRGGDRARSCAAISNTRFACCLSGSGLWETLPRGQSSRIGLPKQLSRKDRCGTAKAWLRTVFLSATRCEHRSKARPSRNSGSCPASRRCGFRWAEPSGP